MEIQFADMQGVGLTLATEGHEASSGQRLPDRGDGSGH
jgi:hypothetical protein